MLEYIRQGLSRKPRPWHFCWKKVISTAKPNSLLDQMFTMVATEKQKKTLEERFYATKNYGGACTYICRVLKPIFNEKFGNNTAKVHTAVVQPVQADDFDLPRISFRN